jgi:hypothetical protein
MLSPCYPRPTAETISQIKPPTNAVITRSYTLPLIIAAPRTPVATAPRTKALLTGGLLQLINILLYFVKETIAATAGRIAGRAGAVFTVDVDMLVDMSVMRHGFPP